jgi:nucleoside-diphosphate-sugar epimerase
MNVLITGGAGFIGSHLTDGLLALGHNVTCIDDLSLGSEDDAMGHISDSTDPAIFAEFLGDLISDSPKRKEMGKYNRQYAEHRFLASRVAMRMEQIYSELADRPKAQ